MRPKFPVFSLSGVLSVLFFAGCTTKSVKPTYLGSFTHRPDQEPTRVVKENRPTLNFDPSKPFRLDFGRGSGMYGLSTISVSEDGRVVMFSNGVVRHSLAQMSDEFWETATMNLPSDGIRELADAVVTTGVTHLDREYHTDTNDGNQWVLCIRQAGKSKSIYFNNCYPDEIYNFESRINRLLYTHGIQKLTWTRLPFRPIYPATGTYPASSMPAHDHDKELWNSILEDRPQTHDEDGRAIPNSG